MYPRRLPRDGIIFVEPEFAGVCPTTNTLLALPISRYIACLEDHATPLRYVCDIRYNDRDETHYVFP
jgi:hypothetical protein